MARNLSTITLNAPVKKVWQALTEKDAVKAWQFGSELITDWKPGSNIKFSTEWQGVQYLQWGKVLEIKQDQLIKYSLFAPRPGLEDKPENYFEMNYVLTSHGETTKLEIIQEDNRPGAVQEEPQGSENPILQALKAYVEKP